MFAAFQLGVYSIVSRHDPVGTWVKWQSTSGDGNLCPRSVGWPRRSRSLDAPSRRTDRTVSAFLSAPSRTCLSWWPESSPHGLRAPAQTSASCFRSRAGFPGSKSHFAVT